MIGFSLVTILCLSMVAANKTDNTAATTHYTLSLTESQVIIVSIIAGCCFLTLFLVILDLMVFSYHHKRRQAMLVQQMTRLTSRVVDLYQFQFQRRQARTKDNTRCSPAPHADDTQETTVHLPPGEAV